MNYQGEMLKVYYELYNQRKQKDDIEARPFKERIMHTLKMIFAFTVALLHPIFGIIIFMFWKYDKPENALWPKIGLILGIIGNLYIFFAPVIFGY